MVALMVITKQCPYSSYAEESSRVPSHLSRVVDLSEAQDNWQPKS